MDVRRHITAGRLAEMFGPDALETDKVVRTLGWRRVAEQEVAELDPEAIAYLEAFSAGVNAYLADTLARRPLAGVRRARARTAWTTGWRTGPRSTRWPGSRRWRGTCAATCRTRSTARWPRPGSTAEQIAELYPPYPYSRNAPVIGGGTVVRGGFDSGSGDEPAVRPARRVPPGPVVEELLAGVRRARRGGARPPSAPVTGVGSNAWVVDGDHSTTGAPILANDPHLAPDAARRLVPDGPALHRAQRRLPLRRLRLHLRRLPRRRSSGTTSGCPGASPTSGPTSATSTSRPSRASATCAASGGSRSSAAPRRSRSPARSPSPSPSAARCTARCSPTSTPLTASVGANAPLPAGVGSPERGSGYAVALAWTALEPARTAQAVFGFNRAQNWDEFRDAARDFAVPGQNMVYADVDGHIGYQAAGKVPVRSPDHPGDYPAPGWDRRYDWTGETIPFRRPARRCWTPRRASSSSANQAVTEAGYRYDLDGSVDYGQRSPADPRRARAARACCRSRT